jgi:hypothetical protein
MTRFADIAGALVASGYRPIPIKPNDKAPAVAAWTQYQYCEADNARYRACGVGLLCGELRAIDIDVRNEQVSARIEALAKSMLNIDGKAPRRIGQWPKTLLMVRSDDGPKMSTAPYRLECEMLDDKPHKVEILGAGQQFVAYGTHPDTGKEYVWNGAGDPTTVTFDSLPYVDPAELHAFLSAAEQILSEYGTRCGKLGRDEYGSLNHASGELTGDYLTIASAIRHVPNADLSRDDWIIMGMAIKGALGEQGRSLWLEWSRSSSKSGASGKADSPDRAWESFKPTKIGAGTIYYEAKRNGWKRPVAGLPDMPEHLAEAPPLEAYAQASPESAPDEIEPDDKPPLADLPVSRLLDLKHLQSIDPPPFEWWVPGWLSPHPTLLSGRGGIGKSLLAMQIAAGCAAGKPIIGRAARPLRVLYWACEDDRDELHRRLHSISASLGRPLDTLADNLYIDARLGLDNTILATAYGRPAWTPTVEILRQQLNDLHIDLLILDNLAHVFAASENDRAAVTMFAAGLCGLILDRPWCPMLIGHVAKSQGSEYAGSTAWENAVRMRWFLGRQLPDAQEDESEEAGDMRVLAKRKSNYSADDVMRLRVGDRVFHVEEDRQDGGTVVGALREQAVRKVVLEGLQALRSKGIESIEQYGKNYLVANLMRYQLAQGHDKRTLERGMRQLLMSGNIRREVVGKKANRMPKEGLIVVDSASQQGE